MLANGPVTWYSERQRIAALSSSEAEIYATDECTRCVQMLHHLHLPSANKIIPLYNDNQVCVMWSHTSTSKDL